MLGFVIAGGCMVGLILLAKKHRHGHFHPGAYGLFNRLQTSPGQEQAIRTELHKLKQAGRDLREQTRESRGELAELLKEERLDESKLQSWVDDRRDAAAHMSQASLDALKKVHAVLDPDQRERAASMVRSFPRSLFWAGRCGYGRHHGHAGHGGVV